ncbi:MAG: IS110 family transposase, partial [Thermoanaerobaculia bacterium]
VQIQATLEALEPKVDASRLAPVRRAKRRKNQLHFEAREVLYAVAGVDLTAVPGLEAQSVLTILSETGTDMSAWPAGEHFAAWLNLPSNRWVTGGKPIRVKAPKIRPNRAAQALRLAAQTLERSKDTYLGAFFRRIRSRIGRPGAIKATAHKLALIIYSMLKNQSEYQELGADYYERRYREKRVNSLKTQAARLGYELTPVTVVH